MTLLNALQRSVPSEDERVALFALSQLTDRQLDAINATTGALSPQIRDMIADYRVANGTGYVIGRLFDVPVAGMSDQDYRTFCFAMTLACRVMLRFSDPLRGLTDPKGRGSHTIKFGEGAGEATTDEMVVDDSMLSAYPSISEMYSDAGIKMAHEEVKTLFWIDWLWPDSATPYGAAVGDALIIHIGAELGLSYKTARRMVARALANVMEPASWKAAYEASPFSISPKVVYFWFSLAREAQSTQPFKEATSAWKSLYEDPGQRRALQVAAERGGPLEDLALMEAAIADKIEESGPTYEGEEPSESGFPWGMLVSAGKMLAKKVGPMFSQTKRAAKARRFDPGERRAQVRRRSGRPSPPRGSGWMSAIKRGAQMIPAFDPEQAAEVTPEIDEILGLVGYGDEDYDPGEPVSGNMVAPDSVFDVDELSDYLE